MANLQDVYNKLLEIETKIDALRSVQKICWARGGTGIKKSAAGETSCPDCGGNGLRKNSRITLIEEEQQWAK